MKRLVILTTLILAAAVLSAQAADQSPEPAASQAADSPPEASSPAEAAPAAADWFWGKPIAFVQWDGIVHADKRELDSATKPSYRSVESLAGSWPSCSTLYARMAPASSCNRWRQRSSFS